MITRGRVLAGVVALAAMIVPLAANAAKPGASPGRPSCSRACQGERPPAAQSGRAGRCTCRSPRPDRSGASTRRAARRRSTRAGCRPGSPGFRSAVSWTSRSWDRRRTRSSASSGHRSRPTSSHVIRGSGSTASTGRRAPPSSRTSAVSRARTRRRQLSRSWFRPACSTRSSRSAVASSSPMGTTTGFSTRRSTATCP